MHVRIMRAGVLSSSEGRQVGGGGVVVVVLALSHVTGVGIILWRAPVEADTKTCIGTKETVSRNF